MDPIVNVRLSYSALCIKIFFASIPVINGDSVLDMTIKGGEVYMKRVQTTDSSGTPLKEQKTDRKSMTLSEFSDSSKEQIGFILNFSDLVAALLPDISITLPDPAADYGTQAHHVLSQYGVVDDDIRFVINGAALLGDENFNEVNLTFLAKDEYKTIEFNTSIDVKLGFLNVSSTVSGSLTLCEKNEMGYLPTDISGAFSGDGETDD